MTFLMWNKFAGGWHHSGAAALAEAIRVREFQMTLCRKYPDSLRWMGGYIAEVES